MATENSTTKAIVIAGVEIVQDQVGRYSLNTLYRASGSKRGKEPSKWLENRTTQELIAELEGHYTNSCIDVVRGGNTPGTYVHELLAVSYAGWISPSFQLRVNQAFLDAVRPPTIPIVKNPSNQLLIDAVVRIDALEQEQQAQRDALLAHQAELIATQQKVIEGFLMAERAEAKADVALEDLHRMTVEEYVVKNGLTRQYPPQDYRRISTWLRNFCQRWGMEVPKAPVVDKPWDGENAYPLQAFVAFTRYEQKRPHQIMLVKEQPQEKDNGSK
jgi:KilA-N domain